ncbi:hydroxyacid dehydrogenase [Candidatus Woesearchaeota archaeon]|nr:hydroxyacid dehydrogenase [Candidatus Woesearchaeota archaeon]
MKIGFFELENWEKEPLQKAFPKDVLVFEKGKLTSKNAEKYKELEAVSVFIYSNLDEKALTKMPKLKLITTRSTGFDHINLKVCKKKNILVCNVPTYGENTVAEHTFALILALSRKIIDCVERTKRGSFDLEGLRGFDLRGKTLGVVGTGNIGKHVVRIAKGLDMNVLAFDAFPNPQLAKEIEFTYVSMDKLLKDSDIVTLHVPYLPQTHHLINKKSFSKMKKGAYLINTSRGGIVDTDALVEALKSGRLAGAGLDVLEEESELAEERELVSKDFPQKCNLKTLIENHILLTMPKVIVTPHNAFNTHEALMRILQTTIDSINGFKSGKTVSVVR